MHDSPSIANRWHDIVPRLSSAAVLIFLTLFATWYHADSFTMLLMIAGVLMGREWQRLNANKTLRFSSFGLVYLGLALFSAYWLRTTPLPHANALEISPYYIWISFVIVWSSDTAAYVFGRMIGGPKLCPRISPKKTWAGFLAALLVSHVVALYCISYWQLPLPWWVVTFTTLAAVGGDLLESWLKRKADVKDSGRLIPGHGGLLDRVDSLLAALPVMAACVWGWSLSHAA